MIAMFMECPSYLNTFTAVVDLSRFNNSRLKLPASTLVDLTFQSRALRYVTCHYRRETYTAASVYLADVIFIPFSFIMLILQCNEPVFILMLRGRVGCLAAVYKESFIREVMCVCDSLYFSVQRQQADERV